MRPSRCFGFFTAAVAWVCHAPKAQATQLFRIALGDLGEIAWAAILSGNIRE